jgi:hypothetical protein
LVSRLELVSVNFDCVCMCYQDRMSDDPRLGGTVTGRASLPVTRAPWSEDTDVVAEHSTAEGFVEGDPVLDLGQGLEHDPGIVGKVGDELVFVQEPSVPLVELVGKIPVKKGDEWDDAGVDEVVDKLDIVVESGLVDGIVASA